LKSRTTGQQYLTKHVKYIDYRIQLLNNYVSLNLPVDNDFNESLISFLISENCRDNFPQLISPEIDTPVRELKHLVRKWDIKNDGDIVGYIYQILQSRDSRKNKGQFFTPGDIVTHLAGSSLERTESWRDVRILDPACGSGQFLLSLYWMLLDRYILDGVAEREASERIIRFHLHGFDIDQTVILIARYNLSRISGIEEKEVNIACHNFLFRENPHSDPPGTVSWPEKYDLVLGNPPWGSRVSSEEKIYFRKNFISSASGINTFTLFLERALETVHDHGLVAFLIPEAYLNIRAHQSSREMILTNTAIKELTIWGERFRGVFAPSISMITQLEPSEEKRSGNVVNIIHGADLASHTSILIPQASYQRTPENIFNINYTRKCVNLITSIDNQDCLFLKNHSKFFLGIVTGNNTQHIYDFKSEEHPDPIILGKDVSPFKIQFSHHYFRYNPGILQQVAPQHLYQAKDKIVYKFIGKRLTFALDRSGYYSLNNVNGFIPDKSYREQLNIESILSILNSDLMQYYYEKNYFTLKVLRGNLERLPLKKISSPNQKRLKQLAEMVMQSTGEAERKHRRCIEDIIYHEYGIKDRDAYTISSPEQHESGLIENE
jgi:predicted RNA methylase